MYCPTCGSNNQEELKFCTRCGTSLDAVSDVLRGRTTGVRATDERMVALLKDYYRGRRMTIIGSAAALIALFKLALLLLLGFPDKLQPLAALAAGLLLLGLLALVWGVAKWNDSSSEIKALGYSPKSKALTEGPAQLRLRDQQSRASKSGQTDPMAVRSSVTEQTTHLLEEPRAHLENR